MNSATVVIYDSFRPKTADFRSFLFYGYCLAGFVSWSYLSIAETYCYHCLSHFGWRSERSMVFTFHWISHPPCRRSSLSHVLSIIQRNAPNAYFLKGDQLFLVSKRFRSVTTPPERLISNTLHEHFLFCMHKQIKLQNFIRNQVCTVWLTVSHHKSKQAAAEAGGKSAPKRSIQSRQWAVNQFASS